MGKRLYCSIPGISNIISVSLNESHSNASTIAIINAETVTADIGDLITIDMGYTTDHAEMFTGYIKNIDRTVPDNTYQITAYDMLVRASDFFIVSSTPDNPFKRRNILLEDLVDDLLALAGLTLFDFEPTFFTIGVSTDVEVNIIACYDICKQLADIVTWSFWADHTGNIYFKNRKPFLMRGDSMQPGDVADVAMNLATPLTNATILDYTYRIDEKDLRNKVTVYGNKGITAEALSSTSYDPRTHSQETILPADFYKTILAAIPYIDTVSEAQDSADYNLYLYNKLTESASMQIEGRTDFHARTAITVSGVTDVSGDWYVYSCEHSLSNSGFTTNLELKR